MAGTVAHAYQRPPARPPPHARPKRRATAQKHGHVHNATRPRFRMILARRRPDAHTRR